VIACTEKAATALHEADLTGPVMLVMGSEDEGISDPVLRMADELVRIPMSGAIASLNVSVATGIVLHAVLHHRMR
jgi:23S rRNA (guanosine2251-2'-O)-methyltransferase